MNNSYNSVDLSKFNRNRLEIDLQILKPIVWIQQATQLEY